MAEQSVEDQSSGSNIVGRELWWAFSIYTINSPTGTRREDSVISLSLDFAHVKQYTFIQDIIHLGLPWLPTTHVHTWISFLSLSNTPSLLSNRKTVHSVFSQRPFYLLKNQGDIPFQLLTESKVLGAKLFLTKLFSLCAY